MQTIVALNCRINRKSFHFKHYEIILCHESLSLNEKLFKGKNEGEPGELDFAPELYFSLSVWLKATFSQLLLFPFTGMLWSIRRYFSV